MTKHEFTLPDGKLLTSVVMSEEEFSELCSLIERITLETPPTNVRSGVRVSKADVDKLREAKYVPMVARGLLTEKIFTQYDILTNLASFIVRGQGENVFFKTFGS